MSYTELLSDILITEMKANALQWLAKLWGRARNATKVACYIFHAPFANVAWKQKEEQKLAEKINQQFSKNDMFTKQF